MTLPEAPKPSQAVLPPEGGSFSGSIRRQTFNLALPAIADNLLQTSIMLVDVALIGRMLGASALAGPTIAWQLAWFVLMVFMGFNVAGTALVARSIGAGLPEEASRLGGQCMRLNALAAAVVSAILMVVAPGLVGWFGADPAVSAQAVLYLRILASTMVFNALMLGGNSILRGAGDTRTPMWVTGAMSAFNALLSWVLIGTMGVIGSALGSAIARLVGGLVVTGLLFKGLDALRLTWEDLWRRDSHAERRIFHIGIPSFVESAIFGGAYMLYLSAVTHLGTAQTSAHTIALRSESLSFMPGLGFAVAAATMVGQSLGAGDPRRAIKSAWVAAWWAAAFMSAMGVIFYLKPVWVIGLFLDPAQAATLADRQLDQLVIAMAVPCLQLVALAQPLEAMLFVLNGALRGAGDTTFVMIATLAGMICIRLPLTYLLCWHLGWNLAGAWVAMNLDILIRGAAAIWRFKSGAWEKIAV